MNCGTMRGTWEGLRHTRYQWGYRDVSALLVIRRFRAWQTHPRAAPERKGRSMARKVLHVALNGVTGRMGYRQHLVRSLLAIREQGGIPLDDGTLLYPEPVLVGRSEGRLRAIAERHGLTRWTTSLDEVLGDPEIDVYFDTQVNSARASPVARAVAAGKHVYREKPVAASAAAAFALAEAARDAGITHGVVQDKL